MIRTFKSHILINFLSIVILAGVCVAGEGEKIRESEFRPEATRWGVNGSSSPTNNLTNGIDDKKDSQLALTLIEQIKNETKPEKKSLLQFRLGLLFFKAGKDEEAQIAFFKSLEGESNISEYIHFHLAKSFARQGQSERARHFYDLVLRSKIPPDYINDTYFQIADLNVRENRWKEAFQQFQFLQKRLKNSDRYPEVLWQLLRIGKRIGNNHSSCRWARDLYAKYPAAPVVADWGFRLDKNKVDGIDVGCSTSAKDQKTRIRRLELNGQAERAHKELLALNQSNPSYEFDALLANHLINEGNVREAFQLLLKYYRSQGSRIGYLLLLAKAAARAGEYPAAVGSYYKAYELSPRSKEGRNALFQAAFMSYQFQDYDGAGRKFEQFIRAFPTSGVTRDAEWHLAWLRYLKGDFKGAYERFSNMSQRKSIRKVRRGKRRRIQIVVEPAQTERMKYWMAMSLLRLEQFPEARAIFQKLANDRGIGFYAIAAQSRLATLPADLPSAKTSASLPTPSGAEVKAETNSAEDSAEVAVASEESDESEESVAAQLATSEEGSPEAGEESDSPDSAEEVSDNESSGQEGLLSENVKFNDPFLARRFERAKDLVAVGLVDAARLELIEIERHTSRSEDRKKLMAEYQVVDSFYRSSYIGETYFGSQRISGGLKDAKQIWEYAYPRAYESTVVSASRGLGVPEELIWGIMRAESHYRTDVMSPVGAVGLMQLMPFTAKQVASIAGINGFEPRVLLDPITNIRLGSRYLSRLTEKFNASLPLVAAGYNAGPHRVVAWVKSFGLLDLDEFIEHIPFIETRNYAKRVVKNYYLYQALYGAKDSNAKDNGKLKPLRWLTKPAGVRFDAPIPTREDW